MNSDHAAGPGHARLAWRLSRFGLISAKIHEVAPICAYVLMRFGLIGAKIYEVAPICAYVLMYKYTCCISQNREELQRLGYAYVCVCVCVASLKAMHGLSTPAASTNVGWGEGGGIL